MSLCSPQCVILPIALAVYPLLYSQAGAQCRITSAYSAAAFGPAGTVEASKGRLHKCVGVVALITSCIAVIQSGAKRPVSSSFYVSQFTVETYCFADGRCLFKQPQSDIYHWNQYDEEISKKCRSVRPSVRL